MKNNNLIYGLLLLVLSTSSLINACSSEDNTASENAEKLIRVNKLMNNVIIASLGSDAVTAINTQGGIVVIDAGISNSLTTIYRGIIEEEFGSNDFAYLINTHSHWDHTGGNQVFSDAIIIGQENCITEISEYWKEKEKIKNGLRKIIDDYDKKLKNIDPEWQDSLEIISQKTRYEYVYNDLMKDRVVTYPGKTFKDTMSISAGDLSFDLIYFGRAHTGSDILIHIPALKLLMTGDLFSPGGRPSIKNTRNKEIERWVKVKRWIKERMSNIDYIINGHGSIMDKGNLTAFIKFFEGMQN